MKWNRTRLIAGAILTVVALLVLGPALHAAREKARLAKCIHYVKSIGLACAMYANTDKGRIPESLDDLRQTLGATYVFYCPNGKDKLHYSYALTHATNLWQVGADTIILREIEANHHGGRVVLYNDGHVIWEKDDP